MQRFLLPLSLVACAMHAMAQTVPAPEIPARAGIRDGAQATGTLTLQAALDLALQANPELSAARHELQAAEAATQQAGVLPNPALDLSVQDTRRETRETTLLLSQPIELGGKRSARLRAAEHGRNAAAAELNARRAELRANVITTFFDVLTAQERLRLSQEAVELAQRATSAAARRVAAGKVSPVEETKARVVEAGVRLEMAQAQSELASARRRLSASWGSAAARFDQVDGRLDALPPLPDAAILAQRLADAPALARALAELERRRALAQVERSRRVPDVTVSLGVKRSEELGRNQAIVGVAVPLPLFDTNRGNVLESLRREDKARDELQAAQVRLDGELAQAHESLRLSHQQAEALRTQVVPGAQSAYDAAAKGFEFGKFGFLDVLDAQRTLLAARDQYLRALADAHRAAAEIDRILGAPAIPSTR